MEEVDGYVGDLNEIFPQHWGPRKARLENTLRITGQACGDMKGCRHFLQTGLKFLSEICNWAGECASSSASTSVESDHVAQLYLGHD